MNFFFNMFNITPVVIIPCALMIIIALSIRNQRIKKILSTIGFIVLFVYIYLLMGIGVPYIFLVGIFENASGIMSMIFIIIAVWTIISLFIYVRNIYIIRKNKIKEIYIRDVEVEYSPAVLSYLMNNKIETKKDLPATLLNLCIKNILKIQESKDGKINIIDMKNKEEVSKLMPDEEYAYKMLTEGITSSKINYWKNKVENEYSKYEFSKEHKRFLGEYLIKIYMIIFIGVLLYFVITGKTEIIGRAAEILSKTMVTTFVGAWEMLILSGAKNILKVIVNRNGMYEFRDTYTKKGAKEYSRWKSFERFIEDYSLINEREYESMVIWGKYLSYSIALGINKKCDNELYDKIKKEYSFNYDLLSRIFEDEEK